MRQIAEVTQNILSTTAGRLLDEKEAATLLGLSHRTLQAWRLKGGGPPYIKMSARAVRYSVRDLTTWVVLHSRSHTSSGAEVAQ
jgi:predicted DNA-binding transcriptional regulator AlpA